MNALPIARGRLEHLCDLEAHLHEQIRGQDNIIPRVVSALQRGELGLSTLWRPRGKFLLLGPTCVGKTEMSIAFRRYLFSNDKLFRFDMSEYQTQESPRYFVRRSDWRGRFVRARAQEIRDRHAPFR